jgi:hypothetical protein
VPPSRCEQNSVGGPRSGAAHTDEAGLSVGIGQALVLPALPARSPTRKRLVRAAVPGVRALDMPRRFTADWEPVVDGCTSCSASALGELSQFRRRVLRLRDRAGQCAVRAVPIGVGCQWAGHVADRSFTLIPDQ